MAVEIPSSQVEFLLLGPSDDRRQLQDSPILGDVWIAYGKAPSKPQELLISPYKTQHAGLVAATIAKGLSDDDEHDASIAYLQGLVVADLKFRDVLRVIVPKTKWWIDRWVEPLPPPAPPKKGRGKSTVQAPGVELVMPTGEKRRFVHEVTKRYFGLDESTHFSTIMEKIIRSAEPWNTKTGQRETLELIPLDRFAALTGLILWAGQEGNNAPPDASNAKDLIAFILTKLRKEIENISDLLAILCAEMLADEKWQKVKKGDVPLVWSVSCNSRALPAIAKSVSAVKADAATTLFKVNCGEIAWAVVDSGIDSNHPAFARAEERVVASSKHSISRTSAGS
jgi:serine protease AprX